MAAIIPTDRSSVQKLELEYAQTVLTAIQKIEATLRKKLIELTTLEARRVELEIALLQQTISQTEEFELVAEKAAALEAKCKEMCNPNVYSYKKVLLNKDINSYFTDLSRDFGFHTFHSHQFNVRGSENAYHRSFSNTTWNALTMPAGCGSFPQHISQIR